MDRIEGVPEERFKLYLGALQLSYPHNPTAIAVAKEVYDMFSNPVPMEEGKQKLSDLQAELTKVRCELELSRSQRFAAVEAERLDATKAFHALCAVHIATPEKGYGYNSSWAISDLCRAVKELKSERDEARQELEMSRVRFEESEINYKAECDQTADLEKQLAASQQRERELREHIKALLYTKPSIEFDVAIARAKEALRDLPEGKP